MFTNVHITDYGGGLKQMKVMLFDIGRQHSVMIPWWWQVCFSVCLPRGVLTLGSEIGHCVIFAGFSVFLPLFHQVVCCLQK